MTNQIVYNALSSIAGGLESATIIKETALKEGATFAIVELDFGGEIFTIPVIHYAGEEFIFTPRDWQGYVPESPEEIEEIEWRVNDSQESATIINGLPRILA